MKIAFNIVVSLQLVAIINLRSTAMPTINTDPIALSPSNNPVQNGTIEFTSMVDPAEKMAVFKLRHGGVCFVTTFKRRSMTGNIMKKIDKVTRIVSKYFISAITEGAKVQVDMDMFNKSHLRFPFISEMCENHLIAAVDFTEIYAKHKLEATHGHQPINSTSHFETGNIPSSRMKCRVALKFCKRVCLIENNSAMLQDVVSQQQSLCTKVVYNCSARCHQARK